MEINKKLNYIKLKQLLYLQGINPSSSTTVKEHSFWLHGFASAEEDSLRLIETMNKDARRCADVSNRDTFFSFALAGLMCPRKSWPRGPNIGILTLMQMGRNNLDKIPLSTPTHRSKGRSVANKALGASIVHDARKSVSCRVECSTINGLSTFEESDTEQKDET